MSEKPGKTSTVTISTILSARTKEGAINFTLNNEETQWDLPQAREIHRMLGGAIEAAVSDELIYKFLVQKVGLSDEKATMVLLDFRELRQGTRGIVFPQ